MVFHGELDYHVKNMNLLSDQCEKAESVEILAKIIEIQKWSNLRHTPVFLH